MVNEAELAYLTKTYSLEVVAAFVEISRGKAPVDVMQELYELAQREVVGDPQAYGLESRP